MRFSASLKLALAVTLVAATVACTQSSTSGVGRASPTVARSSTVANPPDLTVAVGNSTAQSSLLRASDLTVGGAKRSTLDVLTQGGARLKVARGLAGHSAIRFPTYASSRVGHVAIVRVLPTGSDWLSPRRSPLSFGLDLKLDPVSDGNRRDNGDNAMQRGLFTDDAQYKIQVDHRQASCVIRGSAGRVIADLDGRLKADQWYRVGCARSGDTVTLTVATLDRSGQAVSVKTVKAHGSIGSAGLHAALPAVDRRKDLRGRRSRGRERPVQRPHRPSAPDRGLTGPVSDIAQTVR